MGSKDPTPFWLVRFFRGQEVAPTSGRNICTFGRVGLLVGLSKSLPSVQSYDGIEDEPSKKINSAFCGKRGWGRDGEKDSLEGDGNGEKEAEIGRVFAVLYPPFITFSRNVTIPFSITSITFIFRISLEKFW